jgi:hypothetical protein
MSLPKPVAEEGDKSPAEIEGQLRRTVAGYADWAVREWRRTLAHIEKKHAGYVPPGERDDVAALLELLRSAVTSFERMGQDGAGRIDHLAPADVRGHCGGEPDGEGHLARPGADYWRAGRACGPPTPPSSAARRRRWRPPGSSRQTASRRG